MSDTNLEVGRFPGQTITPAYQAWQPTLQPFTQPIAQYGNWYYQAPWNYSQAIFIELQKITKLLEEINKKSEEKK